jgi:hypothetical protein
LQHSEGEALGVRKLACAFCIVNIINQFKAAASLPHSKAPFGRAIHAVLINAFPDRN